MISITDDQRSYLEQDLQQIVAASEEFQSTVETYQFPNHYDDFQAVLARQQEAIKQLLETGELTCDIATLAVDTQQMLSIPHLENMAFIATEAKKIDDTDEQQAFFQPRQEAAHRMRNNAQAALNVQSDLEHLMESEKTNRDKYQSRGDEWKR